MTDRQHKAYFVCNLDVWTKNHEKEVFMLVPEIYKQKYCKSIYKFVARVPLIVGSPLQMNEINRSDT